MSSETFKVFVRVRPRLSKEKKSKPLLQVREDCAEVLLEDQSRSKFKKFSFNGVLNDKSRNEDVYALALKDLKDRVSQGLNYTCLSYGSTGSGKTHTLFGLEDHKEPGLASLALEDLLNAEYELSLSFFEVYNEHIRDLLSPENKELAILELSNSGIQISPLNSHRIRNMRQVSMLLAQGNLRRRSASTTGNSHSSRSHAVLQIYVNSSKVMMIDLAGSERATNSDNTELRLREGANINKSLLALGNCINVLTSNKKQTHVPYRNSKLTRILKDSLGGHAQTVMVACVSPLQYEHTLSTLKYAERAKQITIKSSLNSEEEAKKIESISKKLLRNLEEQWELSQDTNQWLIQGNLVKKRAENQSLHKKLKTMNNNEFYQLLATTRSLELEKLDLSMQNARFSRFTMNERMKSKEKDIVIEQMQNEIQDLRKQLKQRQPLYQLQNIPESNLNNSKSAKHTKKNKSKRNTNQSLELSGDSFELFRKDSSSRPSTSNRKYKDENTKVTKKMETEELLKTIMRNNATRNVKVGGFYIKV